MVCKLHSMTTEIIHNLTIGNKDLYSSVLFRKAEEMCNLKQQNQMERRRSLKESNNIPNIIKIFV